MRFQSRYSGNQIWWKNSWQSSGQTLLSPKMVEAHFLVRLASYLVVTIIKVNSYASFIQDSFHMFTSGYISKIVSVQLMMTNYSFVARWFHVWFGAIYCLPRDNPGNLTKSQHGPKDDGDVDEWQRDDSDDCDVNMLSLPYLCENCWSISLTTEYGWNLLSFCSYASHSYVCSQLFMSICSRGRLLQQ